MNKPPDTLNSLRDILVSFINQPEEDHQELASFFGKDDDFKISFIISPSTQGDILHQINITHPKMDRGFYGKGITDIEAARQIVSEIDK